MDQPRPAPLTALLPLWGLAGVVCILSFAVMRLAPLAAEAIAHGLTPGQWVLAFVWTVFMAYSEAWKGFQKRFSPSVVARAWHLRAHPHWLRGLFAPLFCMGFFHGNRRRLLKSWLLTVMIVCFVLIAHNLSQPWRGIVDMGVVVGLLLGIVSILWVALGAARGAALGDPELP